MDIKHFTIKAPGDLVSVETPWGPDSAFIPASLPPAWDFPSKLWPLLAEAKEAIALLEGIGRGLANPDLLLRPMSRLEALQSSALEGTFATPKELLLFELDPRQPNSDDDPISSSFEIANYRKAMQHGMTSNLPLSMRLFREMHLHLLHSVRGKDKAPGEFRRIQVGIGAGGRFIPPPHDRALACLESLEKYLHAPSTSFDPLVDCFLVHYQFETIHPFHDGNGRIGRVLLAIMLQKRCHLSRPWLYMSSFFNQHREEYIQYLFNVSAKGDWEKWIEFCLQGVLQQARNTIHRCERIRSVKEKYMNQLARSKGSARLIRIVDDLFESPMLEITDLPSRLGVSDPTARADVQKLVDVGILEELPGMRPKVYYAPKLFRIAYDTFD